MLVLETSPNTFKLFEPNTDRVYRTSTTETVIVRREDGSETQDDRTCDPYPVEVRPAAAVLAWSTDEQATLGIFTPVPFVPPEGKQKVGSPRYERVNGTVVEVYDVEDIPEAPATPTRRVLASTVLARMEGMFGLDVANQYALAARTADPIGYDRFLSVQDGVAIDNARLLAGLKGLGLTDDQVTSILAE